MHGSITGRRGLLPTTDVATQAPGVASRPGWVLQFRIELPGVEPRIWRQVEVPDDYSFWDLHVALQDVMGWRDIHPHCFTGSRSHWRVGIPNERNFDVAPSWEHRVCDHIREQSGLPLPWASYVYDFNSHWRHWIRFEGANQRKARVRYPRCLGGARKCPPEDAGGIKGYQKFLRVLATPDDPAHRTMLEWVGGKFDPEEFDPTRVRFDDPIVRWRKRFQADQAAG